MVQPVTQMVNRVKFPLFAELAINLRFQFTFTVSGSPITVHGSSGMEVAILSGKGDSRI